MELSREQQTEYNTVVLAGLLHDIGKFLNRRKEIRERHPLSSVRFIEEMGLKDIVSERGIDVDLDLLKTLVQRHHESKKYTPANQLVQTIQDDHHRTLAYMVSRADNFSSSERDDMDDERGDWYKYSRLFSLFSLINVKAQEKKEKYYQLLEFSPEHIFPIDKESLDRDNFSYNALFDKFSQAVKKVSPSNFSDLFNSLWALFKKYLWAVPSDTWKKKADITLFDHLSTTSAIAASLYLFHKDEMDESKIINDEEEKFILIGGNLSGIQDFLFEISQRNPKKLSQTLRGRSFLLSLLVEMTSLKILKVLSLPYSARLMSSGGRFVILAPNREDVRERLKEFAVEIEEEFFKKFLGKLTLNVHFSTCLSGKDFKIGKVKDKINEVNYGLIRQKLSKNSTVLTSGKYQALLDQCYEKYIHNGGACDFCGVYPKESRGEQCNCSICQTAEKLGKEIISHRFLHFITPPGLFDFLGIGIDFGDEYRQGLLSYTIKGPRDYEIGCGSIPYLISNYLPDDHGNLIREHNQDEDSLCYFCKKNDLEDEDKCPVNNRRLFKETHLSFQCIATFTPYENQGKGVDKLAVFKADIDNLGYIIQYGFDRLRDDEDTSRYSVSRFTFLSRMIDAFFQSWLKHTIETTYPMIYTVYAGGDDLLLIGPWEHIVRFAGDFSRAFNRFFAENDDITLSAGISLFSPHSPVTVAVNRCEEYLECSKEQKGKNAITFFETTVKWDQLPKLFDFSNFLNESILDDDSRLNTAFVYRLFKYHRLFMDYREKGKVEGLRFHSLMNYDIVRNIKRIKNKEVINQAELDRLVPLYVAGDDLDTELLRNLKIPLTISLYKNRGGKAK